MSTGPSRLLALLIAHRALQEKVLDTKLLSVLVAHQVRKLMVISLCVTSAIRDNTPLMLLPSALIAQQENMRRKTVQIDARVYVKQAKLPLPELVCARTVL